MWSTRTRSERLAAVWAVVRDNAGSTVADIASATGLSRPTVTSMLSELRDLDLVVHSDSDGESEDSRQSLGRPAQTWTVNPHAGIIVAIDALVSSMIVVVITLDGEILEASTQPISEGTQGRTRTLVRVTRAAAERHRHRGRLRCLGLSTTGIIDDRGVVIHSDFFPESAGHDLASELSEGIGCPVYVANDINMAAYGEFCSQRDRGHIDGDGDLLFVQLARGINTGLIIGGKIRVGSSFTAGEISDVLGIDSDTATRSHSTWIKKVAQTVSSMALLIDPDKVVVSTPSAQMTAQVTSLVEQIQRSRAQSKAKASLSLAPLDVDIAALGWGASVIGAAHDALHRIVADIFDTPHVPPGVLRHLERIEYALMKGEHTILETQHTSDTNPLLRVGVIGCGARAPLALAAERPENGGRITVVCEPHPDARARVERQLGRSADDVTITRDVAGLIAAGVDVAFVTSPDDTHADITCELLEAGIPVYLEKPLAITVEGANAILETAYRTGTKLYVGHNMRHMSVVRLMRQLIEDGRIGEVKAIWCRHFVGSGGDFYFKDWHATREHGTGLLLQKAAHDIDVMHWLAGAHTNEVVAMGGLTVYGDIDDRADHSHELMRDWYSLKNWPPLTQKGLNPVIDVEDLSMVLMHFDNGVFASYQQCHYTPDYWRNYTVIGTEGRIENFGDGEGGHVKLWNTRTHYNPDGDEVFPIIGDAHGHDDADVLTVTEFIRFVRDGAPTDTNPLSAWYAVVAGINATDSLRDGATPREISEPAPEIIDYFLSNQVKK